MLQLAENFRPLRPVLPPQELHYRNEFFRNWGQLHPLFFKNGSPFLLLPPIKSATLVLIYLVGVLMLNTLHRSTDIEYYTRILLVLLSLLCYIWACASGHGVASSALPLLNQQSYQHYRGFCEPCRVFTGELGRQISKNMSLGNSEGNEVDLISHCKQCRICYLGTFYHSQILGVCMTKNNFYRFLSFNILAALTLARIAILIIF